MKELIREGRVRRWEVMGLIQVCNRSSMLWWEMMMKLFLSLMMMTGSLMRENMSREMIKRVLYHLLL